METRGVDGAGTVWGWAIPGRDRAQGLEREVAPYRAATDTVRFPYNKSVPYGLIEGIVVALLERIYGAAP